MTKNKFAGLIQSGLKVEPEQSAPGINQSPAPVSPSPVPSAAEPVRMLGGRVPDSIFREFQYAKLEAESALGIRRVTTEEAVEAFVRMLRDEDVKARWREEVSRVRREKR